jgi:general secretion pathway protein G
MNTRRFHAGFTLMELLVVLVIIALLGGLVGPRFFKKADEAKIQAAQTQARMLKGALDTMRLDIGRYPTAGESLTMLVQAPRDDRISPRWKGPYLDEALPVDPWGNPYQYALPGANGQPVAVYSLGADGKRGGDGADADIGLLPP